MSYDAVIVVGVAITIGLMHVTMKRFGVGGGFAAFFAGVMITASASIYFNIDTDFETCTRYSSFASSC